MHHPDRSGRHCELCCAVANWPGTTHPLLGPWRRDQHQDSPDIPVHINSVLRGPPLPNSRVGWEADRNSTSTGCFTASFSISKKEQINRCVLLLRGFQPCNFKANSILTGGSYPCIRLTRAGLYRLAGLRWSKRHVLASCAPGSHDMLPVPHAPAPLPCPTLPPHASGWGASDSDSSEVSTGLLEGVVVGSHPRMACSSL